ncbi:MAG: ABC transporter permease subunit, partial [Desulfurococcaceae archaeon]
MRRVIGPYRTLLLGALIGSIYAALYLLQLADATVVELLWLASAALGFLVYVAGFDYYSVKFSYAKSLLVFLSLLYVVVEGMLALEGAPMAIAIALLPLIAATFAGYIGERRTAARAAEGAARAGLARRIRNTLFELDPVVWAFVFAGVAYLTLFLVIPVATMLAYSFVPPAGGTPLSNFYDILRNRFMGYVRTPFPWETAYTIIDAGGVPELIVTGVNYGILLNSLIVAAIVTSVATVLGVVVAFVIARYDFPGRNVLRVLAMVPLFVTPFVNAFVVKELLSDYGLLSMITYKLFGFKIMIKDLAGIAVAQIITFYPIVYLNTYSSLINIDPSMEEQAENLGARGLRLFTSVTLPLALPGIAAGAVLVYIFSLEDLGSPIIFNYPNVMSYQIFTNFLSQQGVISPQMAALGVVMLLLAVMGFIMVRNYVGMRAYAMISRGGRLVPRVRRPGPLGLLAIYLFVFPLVIFTAMPQISVVLMALNVLPPFGFQLRFSSDPSSYLSNFASIFIDPNVVNWLKNTLLYATSSVLIAVLLSVMIGYSAARIKIRWLSNLLDSIATVPIAIPGLVIALGYLFFFGYLGSAVPALSFLNPFSVTTFQAWSVLVISFSVRRLPYVVRSVYA